MYTLQWTKNAVQHLAKLPKGIQASIARELSHLCSEGETPSASEAFHHHAVYTLEVGHYQIALWVMDASTILVFNLVETPHILNLPQQHQVIMHENTPVAVVVPYADYLSLTGSRLSQDEERLLPVAQLEEDGDETKVFPHAIVTATIGGDSLMKAWREYLGLSCADVAKRMKIAEDAYELMESKNQQVQIRILCNVAKALGVRAGQLFLYQ